MGRERGREANRYEDASAAIACSWCNSSSLRSLCCCERSIDAYSSITRLSYWCRITLVWVQFILSLIECVMWHLHLRLFVTSRSVRDAFRLQHSFPSSPSTLMSAVRVDCLVDQRRDFYTSCRIVAHLANNSKGRLVLVWFSLVMEHSSIFCSSSTPPCHLTAFLRHVQFCIDWNEAVIRVTCSS